MGLKEMTSQNIGLLLYPKSESAAEIQGVNFEAAAEMTEDQGTGYPYPFLLNVSFEEYQDNGMAVNEAKVYLRAEDYILFMSALIGHEDFLPANYRQWKEDRPDGVCVHIVATEPPGRFAARLTAVMKKIKC